MKLCKQIFSILLTITLILSICVTAVAEKAKSEELITSFTINEYDAE